MHIVATGVMCSPQGRQDLRGRPCERFSLQKLLQLQKLRGEAGMMAASYPTASHMYLMMGQGYTARQSHCCLAALDPPILLGSFHNGAESSSRPLAMYTWPKPHSDTAPSWS